jgi:expansin
VSAERDGDERRDRHGRRISGPVLRRCLAAGGAVVLAGLVAVVLLLRTGSAPACAGPPRGSLEQRGEATFYDPGGGNCSYPALPADGLVAALGPAEYVDAAACGGYLDVTGPAGSVRVKVTDRCPECAPGHLDLSRQAFARIADPARGQVPITYRAAVNPPVPGPLSFRIKEGASRYWFAVLVDNHANPLASVEATGPGGTWRRTVRHDYNYWIVDSGLGPGPYSIRVTDIRGRQATAAGITMSPGLTQRTSIRMTGPAAGPSRSADPSRQAGPSGTPGSTAAPVAPTAADPEATDPAAATGGQALDRCIGARRMRR